MSKMLEYHRQAMEFIAQVTVSPYAETVDDTRKQDFFKQALELELKAIDELEKHEYHALTYSLIHRSAASTALDCGNYELAERLAAKAIARGADPAILQELRHISHEATFNQNLQLSGIELRQNDVQMSLDGSAVGNDGIILWTDWSGRISTVMDLINKIIKDAVFKPPVYISRPIASSFAVTIRLASPIDASKAFDGMDPVPAYIDKFMNSMNAVNELDVPTLYNQFDDPKERAAFLNMARKIAPDGQRITQVGFKQAQLNNEDRTVSITKTISALPMPGDLTDRNESDELIAKGKLLYADGTNEKRRRIRIVDGKKQHSIRVPENKNINHIVDEMWDCDVKVVATRVRGDLELQDIEVMQPNMFT